MELRHLRYFIALAEELHFTRAAERLHIEQSPLSRTIKELEEELGLLLFDRDRRGTRLTQAGNLFLQDVRRLFVTLEQARENVRAFSAGYRSSLRIAVSDGATDPRLSEFLARCREEEPEVEIRLAEVSLSEQLRGLRSGDFSIGFAHTANVGDGILAEPIWHTPLIAAVPVRHPLLVHKALPLKELTRFPLVMCDPQVCEGNWQELNRLLGTQGEELNIVGRVASLGMMLTLVAAGYGIGFMSAVGMASCKYPNIVTRPLASELAVVTTYLLRLDLADPPTLLERFRARLHAQRGV